MDADELAEITSKELSRVGAAFYFDLLTAVRGEEFGLNSIEFYALGRGGVLGDVEGAVVDEAFTFFDSTMIRSLWDAGRVKVGPEVAAEAYLQSAFDYADRTFGAIDTSLLGRFARAARTVAVGVTPGRCALFDGYLRFAPPASPVHAAIFGAILMRELRGGLHIDAVHDVGLRPVDACYMSSSKIFALHGYNEADVPVVTVELEQKRIDAEQLTSAWMSRCLEVLSEPEREDYRAGALAMYEALKSPVAV